MQTGRKKVNLSKTITLKLSIILGLFLAIINPMTTAAQARSTTDWIKKSSSVINGDYSVTHYMTTYYMESNTAESAKRIPPGILLTTISNGSVLNGVCLRIMEARCLSWRTKGWTVKTTMKSTRPSHGKTAH